MTNKEQQETISSPEKTPAAEAFEHLFPGNNFADLPANGVATLTHLFELATMTNLIRNNLLEHSSSLGSDFAVREELSKPNKFVINRLLKDVTIVAARIRGVLFNGHSLAGLVDRNGGETLGGAVERPTTAPSYGFEKIPVAVGGSALARAPQTLIGVLSADGQPAAIIYLVEPESSGLPAKKHRPGVLTRQLQGAGI